MDDLRPHGPGRLVLQGLAILSALTFLGLLMLQAMAFYAPTPEAPKPLQKLLGPATKAAPVLSPKLREEQKATEDPAYLGGTKSATVIPPTLQGKPREPSERGALLPATKAGILGPLKLSPPAQAPQQQGTSPRN
jgi:hypothetical protein